jgi:hypothetical protein
MVFDRSESGRRLCELSLAVVTGDAFFFLTPEAVVRRGLER